MNASTLDTHRAVKRLLQAGFSTEQAETVTDVLRETRELDLSELATKSDLRTLEATLTGRIAESSRATLQWAVGLFVAQTAIIVGLVKLLH